MQFRHAAGFGKRIEHWVVGQMLKEGLDVYLPTVDDNGVDAVVRRSDGTFVEVQIKARSKDSSIGHGALFASISHEYRKNYCFIFYSERLDTTLILSSKELLEESTQNKRGKNKGVRTMCFNGTKKNKISGKREEYVKERYKKYCATNYAKIVREGDDELRTVESSLG